MSKLFYFCFKIAGDNLDNFNLLKIKKRIMLGGKYEK